MEPRDIENPIAEEDFRAQLKRKVFYKENMGTLNILFQWALEHNVVFSGPETAVILSAMEEYSEYRLRDFGEWICDNDSFDYHNNIDNFVEEYIENKNIR